MTIKKKVNFFQIFLLFFVKWLWNLHNPVQDRELPKNVLILSQNIENKRKKSFSEESKLCPCWGTVPPSTEAVRVLWFFQNKLTYFDLFYHFIMGKIGPKFSQIVSVRLEGGDPPKKNGHSDCFSQFFFTPPLTILNTHWAPALTGI